MYINFDHKPGERVWVRKQIDGVAFLSGPYVVDMATASQTVSDSDPVVRYSVVGLCDTFLGEEMVEDRYTALQREAGKMWSSMQPEEEPEPEPEPAEVAVS